MQDFPQFEMAVLGIAALITGLFAVYRLFGLIGAPPGKAGLELPWIVMLAGLLGLIAVVVYTAVAN